MGKAKSNNISELLKHLKSIGVKMTKDEEQQILNQLDKKFDYTPRIGILGKTGAGKSSLVNTIVGKDVCPVSAVGACTREISEQNVCNLIFIDCPGVGESEKKDNEYRELYKNLIPSLDSIIWILQGGTRKFTEDIAFYNTIKDCFVSDDGVNFPLIFALNQIDNYKPSHSWLKKENSPSGEQLINIKKAEHYIASQFGVPSASIISISATNKYNIVNLLSTILYVLPSQKNNVSKTKVEKSFSEDSLYTINMDTIECPKCGSDAVYVEDEDEYICTDEDCLWHGQKYIECPICGENAFYRTDKYPDYKCCKCGWEGDEYDSEDYIDCPKCGETAYMTDGVYVCSKCKSEYDPDDKIECPDCGEDAYPIDGDTDNYKCTSCEWQGEESVADDSIDCPQCGETVYRTRFSNMYKCCKCHSNFEAEESIECPECGETAYLKEDTEIYMCSNCDWKGEEVDANDSIDCPCCGETAYKTNDDMYTCSKCKSKFDSDDTIECPSCGETAYLKEGSDIYMCTDCDWQGKDYDSDDTCECPECGETAYFVYDDVEYVCPECGWHGDEPKEDDD